MARTATQTPPAPPGSERTSAYYRTAAPPVASTRSATPDGSSPFVWPRNASELAQALQSFADERYVGMLDPRTAVELDQTITISQAVADGNPWGVNGNYAKINWVGAGGQDMLIYRGVKGMGNRNLVVEKLNFFGNGYAGAACGDCLKLLAPEGDPGSIYKFTLRDIYTGYGTRGIVLEGAVFEGLGFNVHAENHKGDGIAMANTYTPGEHQGIVSNVMLIHPNSSRNMGAGIRSVQSCNIFMGSFILNAQGGVIAPDGLRYAAACNGENTGESVFVVPYAGWGSEVSSNTGASNGQTVATDWSSGSPVEVGKIAQYLLDNSSGDVPNQLNSMASYGEGPPCAVLKPYGGSQSAQASQATQATEKPKRRG
jgi:hypothetical protein